MEPDCAVLNGHKAPVLDISFSPFHSNLMATGSDDCSVKVWRVPDDDAAASGQAPVWEYSQHRAAVRTSVFHPTVSHLLVSASLDTYVRLLDVSRDGKVKAA